MTRDKAGRITQKQETVAGTTSNYAYTYDPMGRLLTVTKDGSLIEQYQYGPNGARISEMNALRGISSRSMAYTEEDHLYQAGDTTYQYDVDCFLISKTKGAEKTEYAYSSRGELLQVKLPDGKIIDYIYGPYGRRIAKAVNGVITEKYLWQGLTRLLAVYDGSNNLIMRFGYVDGRMPVAMTSGGNTYYLTYDQVGSLRVVSNASGNVVKRIDYDSFGNIINDTNPSFTIPFAFAGGLYDRDVGLIRFGLRDYDPDIGRWTAKDPMRFAGGDADLYGYCLNDPINLTDPSGLWTCPSMFKRKGPCGSGEYEAPREGGRLHPGVDYCGWLVYAPISGIVEYVYQGYNKGIKICGWQNGVYYCVYLLHIDRLAYEGSYVNEGGVLGFPLSTEGHRCQGMYRHVHVEVYRRGKLINPDFVISCD